MKWGNLSPKIQSKPNIYISSLIPGRNHLKLNAIMPADSTNGSLPTRNCMIELYGLKRV